MRSPLTSFKSPTQDISDSNNKTETKYEIIDYREEIIKSLEGNKFDEEETPLKDNDISIFLNSINSVNSSIVSKQYNKEK